MSDWIDIERARLFADADRIAEEQRAEAKRREDAILRKYEPRQIAPQSWFVALSGLAIMLWTASVVLAFVGMLAVL